MQSKISFRVLQNIIIRETLKLILLQYKLENTCCKGIFQRCASTHFCLDTGLECVFKSFVLFGTYSDTSEANNVMKR